MSDEQMSDEPFVYTKKLFSIFTRNKIRDDVFAITDKESTPSNSLKTVKVISTEITKMFDDHQLEFINMPIDYSGKFYGIPGGGKTTAIVERLRRAIKKQLIPESNGFLLVTFSNQGVKDFIERGCDDTVFNRDTVSTFHSLAGKILSFLAKMSSRNDIEFSVGETSLKKVVSYSTSIILKVSSEVLRSIPFLRDVRCATIDEAQDINSDQYTFIKELSKKLTIPLVLVGDPNQSIYEFQGGSSIYLVEHPGFCVQSIVNYRSSPEIVDVLNAIMPIPLAHGLRMTSSLDDTITSSRKKPRLLIGSMRDILGDILIKVKHFLLKGEIGKTMAVIGPVKNSRIQNEKYTSLALNTVLKYLQGNDIPCVRHYRVSDDDGNDEKRSHNKKKRLPTKSTEKDVSSGSKIHFMTVHASKGLEFDDVILLNYQLKTQSRTVEDMKQYRSCEYIWYVGFSRPKETLSVYHLEDNDIWPGYEEQLQKHGLMNAYSVNGCKIVIRNK